MKASKAKIVGMRRQLYDEDDAEDAKKRSEKRVDNLKKEKVPIFIRINNLRDEV